MPDYKMLTDNSSNFLGIFTAFLFSTVFVMLLLKFLMPKRYNLNIKAPNIYIFEYEASAGYLLSVYNFLSLFIKLLSYILFTLAILFFCQKVYEYDCLTSIVIKKIIPVFIVYMLVKLLLEVFYLGSIKKQAFISKIRFIRLSYENYLAFYLFVIAFLSFFFPVKNQIFFIVTITISMFWIILVLWNFYNALTKHIDIKKYQIILYLCLSEILPFISLIGWIIFQIL